MKFQIKIKMSIKSDENLIINGKYKILDNKEKGSGAYSEVFLAENITNKKQYAIKVLKESFLGFEKEISMHQKVSSANNPYIVNLVDFGVDSFHIGEINGNKQYAVLEYASNGELFDLIKKTKSGLKERHAKFIFSKILKGVQAIHKLGMCHRDLKPQNILLDEHFNPKICDFGFTTETDSGKLHDYLGTQNYAAPEMFLKRPYNGIQIDIFSLGVILLNLVSAKIGFIEANINDRYYRYIMTRHYKHYWEAVKKQIGELSDEFKSLYLKMVDFCGDKRPSIDEILKHPWMKEINELNEMEYEILEKEVYEEFVKLNAET
jgi:serine/threonine protein kinase